MIPKNIGREHVLAALEEIDRDGIPREREATRFALLAGERRYPPKYVLALASRYANHRPLKPADFSGGSETNDRLRELGFTVAPERAAPAEHTVVTVLIERSGFTYSRADRDDALRRIVDHAVANVDGSAVIVFPGGWFKAGRDRPETIRDDLVQTVAAVVASAPRNVAVSFGLDGRKRSGGTLDQTALFVSAAGLLGMARKWYPAKGETIDASPSWDAGEGDQPRIVNFDGRRYYLAVCYDGFGIKHKAPKKPAVDAILDHVHGFDPDESEVLFARHGFAGASLAWRCPVFAAAVFFNRDVPESFPSGVRWKGAPRSTMEWSYRHNGVSPRRVSAVEIPEGRAVLRMFGLDAGGA